MSTELKRPGVVRTYGGTLVDIRNPDPDSLHVTDIAWSLGRILRYNGSIKHDYTVAHHSIIMSYYVDEDYALEALFHDAAEAYMGDVIWPIKALYPEMEEDESILAAVIMKKFAGGAGIRVHELYDLESLEDVDVDKYTKSPKVAQADHHIFQHECFSFGDRPGTYHPDMQKAWLKAIDEADGYWHAPMYAFLYRYHELIGSGLSRERINKLVEPIWFPTDIVDYRDQGLSDEQALEIVESLEEGQ